MHPVIGDVIVRFIQIILPAIVLATSTVALEPPVIAPSPDQMLASGFSTSTISVSGIVGADGNPVADGTKYLLFATYDPNGISLDVNTGTIEGGTKALFYNNNQIRVFTTVNGGFTATFRAPTIGLGTGQFVQRYIALWTTNANEQAVSRLGYDTVSLYGPSRANIAISPTSMSTSNVNTGTVTITNIHDANGNPLADNSRVIVLAAYSATGFSPDANAGIIEGGIDSANGASAREFRVTNGAVITTYRAPTLALSQGEIRIATIQLWATNQNGQATALIGATQVKLTSPSNSSIVATPDRLLARPTSTASIVVSNLRDGNNQPVPDGTKIALFAAPSDSGANPSVDAGVISGGDNSPSGSLFRLFTVQSGQVTTTYTASDGTCRRTRLTLPARSCKTSGVWR
jgi:hypothetical protein